MISKAFKNKNVMYIMTVLVLLSLTIYFWKCLERTQKKYVDLFKEKAGDMNKCQGASEYFITWQQTYDTFVIPSIIACIGGLISFAFLYTFAKSSEGITLEESIMPLFFYITLTIWVTTYKISNCMLARLCDGGCAKPFFAGLSPA